MRNRIFIFMLALTASFAHAAVIRSITFDDIPNEGATAYVWEEDGITANGYLAYWLNPGTVHLDGAYGPFGTAINISTGSLFDVKSADILPLGSDYCSEPNPDDCRGFDDPYPYIGFDGYLEGSLIWTLSTYLSSDDTISLEGLATIDQLQIRVRDYTDFGLCDGDPYSCSALNSGGHFDVDSVALMNVPEPSTLALISIGLLGLGFMRLKQSA